MFCHIHTASHLRATMSNKTRTQVKNFGTMKSILMAVGERPSQWPETWLWSIPPVSKKHVTIHYHHPCWAPREDHGDSFVTVHCIDGDDDVLTVYMNTVLNGGMSYAESGMGENEPAMWLPDYSRVQTRVETVTLLNYKSGYQQWLRRDENTRDCHSTLDYKSLY